MIHEPSCPQSCGLKKRSKRGRSVTKLFACSSGVRLSWAPGVGESVGTLVSTSYKRDRARDVCPASSWHRTVMARLNIRPHMWIGVLKIWEQEPLPPELRWCLELGNKGYAVVCSKIIFRFSFGCMLISALGEALEEQEHILSLGDGSLPKSNPESDQNTAPLALLQAPGFDEYGSQVRKWIKCGRNVSIPWGTHA